MPSPQALAATKAIFAPSALNLHSTDEIASLIDSHFPTPFTTPNSSLPPLDSTAPRRKMVITIDVAADFEKRLDNQWMVEREIAADRWEWCWADEISPFLPTP